jgi:integrase
MLGLKKALASKGPERHFAAITDPVKFGQLLRAIEGYQGHPTCTSALKVAPYVFVRPVELRTWEWKEIDFERAEWSIPGEKMKMENDHIVPLARQVVALLREQMKITGRGKYVYPTISDANRPMSDGTVNAALRALGYSGDMHVGHGFRASARTMMDEVLRERVDLIEHQLAHEVTDPNGRAYNRTAFLHDRREMMQRWADYLDKIRAGAEIVPLRPHG